MSSSWRRPMQGACRSACVIACGEHVLGWPARARLAGRMDPFDCRPQVGGGDRLGDEVIDSRLQAALAVRLPRPGGDDDDREMAPGRAFPGADGLDHLE